MCYDGVDGGGVVWRVVGSLGRERRCKFRISDRVKFV